MKIFTASATGKCLLVVFTLFVSGLNANIFAQDDPTVDTPLPREVVTPRSGPASITVITTPDGFDNFDLGTTNAEPHMSTNPLNPLWFFNAFNTNTSFHTENGVTWTTNNPAFPSAAGDPVTAYDSLGNLFYETMKSPITGCWVVKSTNNGQTWGTAASAVSGNDKNWIAADQTMGPYANYIYTTMTNTPGGSGVGSFSRSTDGGTTWTNTFSPTTQVLPGMMVAVGPNVLGGNDISGGCVYVVTHSGTNGAGIYTMYASTNGGLTFTQKSQNQFSNYIGTEISGRSTVWGMRCRPYPMIAADNSFGPYRGRLYLVYASNNPSGNGNRSDIFLRYSTDQGANWTDAVVVNDDPSQSNFQFHPAIWCDKQTGRLYIKFYDTRNTPTADSTDVYATYSDDGGVTFAINQRLTNRKFRILSSSSATYRGDYDAITSNMYGAMAVWTDFRNAPSPNYLGMTAYFPDFAMLVAPGSIFLNPTDSGTVRVKVPGVKLYTNVARFTASVSPSASFTFSWVNGRDSLTTYPDSLTLKIGTIGVAPGAYTVTVAGSGPNGTPVHRRTIMVNVTSDANSVTVNSPNGGENWLTNSLHNITWGRAGVVDSVKLEYSTNNGTSWIVITPGVPALPASYAWTVPNTTTTQGRVRVSWTDSASVNDVSNAAFIISPSTFPIISVTPDSVVASLEVGSHTVTDTLLIRNTGTEILTWSLSEVSSEPGDGNPGELAYYTAGSQLPKGADDGMSINAGIDGQGGPDAYGYTWIDSDEPGGPTFNWVDISGTGTTLDSTSAWIATGTFRANDEGYFPVALPFTFNYYGVAKESLFIGTNGYCSFQRPTANAFTNAAFPTAGGALDNHLGVWWDDLEVRASGKVHYGTNAGNFVVQYDSIPLYNAAVSNYSFQLILSPGGEWKYQYRAMGFGGGTLSSSTIGMENADGTIGLTVTHNAPYMHDNLAIRFGRGVSWLSEDTTSGSVNAGGAQNVQVTFNSAGLAIGTYRATIVITSNDAPRSPWNVPARLTVTDVVPVHEAQTGVPTEFALMQNYPNPFNPNTTIGYVLPKDAFVRLTVTNVLGQEVLTLQEGLQPVGFHSATWNGTNKAGRSVASGVYFYRMEARTTDGSQTFGTMNKMLMLK